MGEPYKAYLDETNVHDNSQWCFVAGHLGTEEQWKDFDGKWREGLGKCKSLHMKDLQWNRKPDRVARLLKKLGPIPDSCKLMRIFGSVRGEDYLDIAPTYPEVRVHFDPFLFALWPCVVQTLRHLPRTERVIFTFEENTNYSSLLSFIEDSLGADDRFITPSGERRAILAAVPKGVTPRTESADYLAFEMGQYQINMESFKAKAGASIMGDLWMIGKQFSRAEIRLLCNSTILLAKRQTAQDVKRRNAIKALIRKSEAKKS